jgi:multisubunit Na+/H+ antiporter MnhG subunit
MFEDFKNIKSGKKELREFGITIGIILIILGALVLWRGRRAISPRLFITGALFIILGLTLPGVLKPLQKLWMGFSITIGFFVSRVILFVLFYVVLTPMGLLARLLGKDILDQKIDKSRKSYWQDREDAAKTKESYENQY